MNNLEKKELLDLIIENCKKHDITAYKISKNTELSIFTARQILNGSTKNPSKTTIETILEYLEKINIGTAVPGHKNYNPQNSPIEEYPQNKESSKIETLKNLLTANEQQEVLKSLDAFITKVIEREMKQPISKIHDDILTLFRRDLKNNEAGQKQNKKIT